MDQAADAGSATGLTPLGLDQWHRRQGARMGPFAGCLMPIHYEGIIAEHRWTRSSASLFDVSHMGQLVVHGADCAAALETLLPADLEGLGDGRLRYSLLLDEEGGILDDLIVTRREDDFFLVVNGSTRDDDIAELRRRLPRTLVVDHMKEQALLALQGPRSAEVLERIAPGVCGLGFMEAAAFGIDGATAWISRSGYTGEDGFEISIAAAAAESLADRLVADQAVRPAGLGARDTLRLEAGLPLYGHDIDRSVTPVMAGLAFAISPRRRTEGGFAGAMRLLAELAGGAPVARVGLAVDGRQPVREGAAVLDPEGSEVGKVTSGTFSPTLERVIVMARVATPLAAPGTRLILQQRGKLFAATVVPLPFVPHRYHRKDKPE